MSKKLIKSLRGFQDILPSDVHFFNFLEETIKATVNHYGVSELRIPLLENAEVFDRSLGDDTDIVNKEMYIFSDKNNEKICLRPEGTSSIVRCVLEHGLVYDRGIKRKKYWYYGPMFRYEKPQRGRYRQFNQFGLEFFGYAGVDSEVEIILIVNKILKQLKISEITFCVNTIGNKKDREDYCKIIESAVAKNKSELTETAKITLEKNPLRLLDSKDDHVKSILKEIPSMIDIMCEESKLRFKDFLGRLEMAGVEYTIDNAIVRGLDYYNDTVFEWKSKSLGSQDAICAGGRYDYLIQSLYDTQVPAVGVAFGVERLVELIKLDNNLSNPAIYPIIKHDDSEVSSFLAACEKIRNKYPSSAFFSTDPSASFSSQIKYSKKLNDKIAIIINNDQILIKHHNNEDFTEIDSSELDNFLE